LKNICFPFFPTLSGGNIQAYYRFAIFLSSPLSTGYFLKNKRFVFFKAVKIVKNILLAFVSQKSNNNPMCQKELMGHI